MTRARLGRAAATAAALVAGLASGAAAHGESRGTFDDLQHAVFNRKCATSGCHLGSSPAGSLSLAEGDAWAELVGFGVGQRPANSAAADNLKMRVDPGRPWNSYFVDKIRARLKAGEGASMPFGQGPLGECEVREIERWILAGAPDLGFVPGDERHSGKDGCNAAVFPDCAIDPCDPSQPVLAQPAPPAQGVQLHVLSAAFDGHDGRHEQRFATDLPAGFATRIEVFARAGTEHVTVHREGDEVPLAVALGDPGAAGGWRDGVAPPEGSGIPVAAGQSFVVRQAVLADRFRPGGVAEAWVNVHVTTEPGIAALEPFLDSFGTEALFVAPRAIGPAGGLWRPEGGARVVALRVWTDPRAVRAAAVGTTGVLYESTGAPAPYAAPDGGAEVLPGTGIGYVCEHDNTHLIRTPRWSCSAPAAVVAGAAVPPAGRPLLTGEPPAPWCATEADCDEGCAAPACCVAASLTGGPGAEDGRCALVGLRAAAE